MNMYHKEDFISKCTKWITSIFSNSPEDYMRVATLNNKKSKRLSLFKRLILKINRKPFLNGKELFSKYTTPKIIERIIRKRISNG